MAILMSPLANGVLLALSPEKAITQYGHGIWSSEDGLPQNSILAIAQTRDGYLWLGTEEGLARYDGVNFTVFDKANTDGIKHNHITSLYEDKDGVLWIGTQGGLSRLTNGRFKTFTTEDGLSNDSVLSVYEDQAGNLWIGTNGGLNRFKDGKFNSFTTRDGLSNDRILSIFQDTRGSLWIGTQGGGLSKLKDGIFSSFSKKDGLSNDVVYSIYEDKDGSLWIGTGAGLNRFANGKFEVFTPKDGLTHYVVRSICADNVGSLWIGTGGGGLDRLNNGKFTAFTAKEGLSNDRVLSLYKDREGSLWVGTQFGLNRFKDEKFSSIGTRDGLSHDVVLSIYQDRQGNIWFGTQGGGLNRFADGKFTYYTMKEGLPNDVVRSIYEDTHGNLWIGTNGGLNRLKDGKFTTFTKNNGLSNNSVLALYEDNEGSLWIGTGAGLDKFKDGKFTSYTTQNGLSSNVIRAITGDEKGSLWIGTDGGGLNRFKDGNFTIFTIREGLSNNSVLSLLCDKEGNLWIGTDGGGLNLFREGRFTTFNSRDGLSNDVASQILEDGNGNLWLTCKKGIYRLDKKELTDFANGTRRILTSVIYGISDGLKTKECNGGWRAKDGKLWFATMKGVAIIDLNNLKLNLLPPSVVIERVLVDGHDVDPKERLQAPPGAGELDFHFTALSLLVPDKVKFKYRLVGFDNGWIEAGSGRSAHYTNLPPGPYEFKVIACNNDGVWNETGASVGLYLQPHFYQTRWFYALCALAVMLLGFGLYRLRVRQLRRRTQELEVIVDQRTGELKRSQEKVLKFEKLATEQQMAGGFAHEMRNALAGSKLILDQALALDGPEPHVSLNLANCRNLKEMYLELKDKLPENNSQVMLGRMQTIFANEERLDEVMQLVRKATTRGLNITQQIMDYAKMGQQQPGEQCVDLRNLLVSIVNESREEFSSQGVIVEYKSEHLLLSLIGDENHFYSIIKNIILNARDALIDPSLKDRKDRRIEITTALEGGICSVVIADNGIGIPQENLPQVFEPFFSTKPATGTGLGLGMVKKMVSLYNGKIAVSSEVDKGTRVTISLPVSWQAETL